MRRRRSNAQRLALLGCAAGLHLGIGLRELVSEEPWQHKASAWQLLFTVLPEPVWDVAWILVGLAFLAGLWWVASGRAAFVGSALIFGFWSAGSFWSYAVGAGATVYQSATLGYLALMSLSVPVWLDTALTRAETLQLRAEELTARLARLERIAGGSEED